MGIFDFFGGGGEQQTSSRTTVTQQLSPEQQRLLAPVLPIAENFVRNPPQQFPGSAIAPLDPAQLQAQQRVLQLGREGGPLSLFTGAAQQAGLSLLDPRGIQNPALDRAIEGAIRPLTRAFETVTLPNIRGEAVAAGGFGGSRQGIAEGLASQGLFQSIGDVTASVESEAFSNQLDAMVKALFAAPQTAQLPLLPAAATEAVGIQRQQREQAELSEQVQRFINEQLIPFNAAQQVAALAFGIPAGTTTTSSTLPPGGGGGFDLQALGSFAATVLPIFL